MSDLSGRVAVVTGGARGQGRAHALALARAGADVAVCDICRQIDTVPYPMATDADLAETVKEVEALGRRCVGVQGDVRSASEMQRFTDTVMEDFGRIDFVCANAGIWSIAGRLWEIPEEAFDRTIEVDVKGVWQTLKYTVPKIIAGGNGGSIVVTSSTAGLKGYPNVSHYVTAKHAVLGMMKSLANELAGYRIRVNALAPGMVNTDMIYFQEQYDLFSPADPTLEGYLATLETISPIPTRYTDPEDQANAVVFLCSDESRYLTGAVLPVAAGANVSP